MILLAMLVAAGINDANRCEPVVRAGDAPAASITDAPLGGLWWAPAPFDARDGATAPSLVVDVSGQPANAPFEEPFVRVVPVHVPGVARAGERYAVRFGTDGAGETLLTVVDGAPVAVTAAFGDVSVGRVRQQECECSDATSTEPELAVAVTGGPAILDAWPDGAALDEPPPVVESRLVAAPSATVGLGDVGEAASVHLRLRDPQTLAVLAEKDVPLAPDGADVEAAAAPACGGCGCSSSSSSSSDGAALACALVACALKRRAPGRARAEAPARSPPAERAAPWVA